MGGISLYNNLRAEINNVAGIKINILKFANSLIAIFQPHPRPIDIQATSLEHSDSSSFCRVDLLPRYHLHHISKHGTVGGKTENPIFQMAAALIS